MTKLLQQDKIAIRLLDELTNNKDDNVNFDDDEWDKHMKNDWANDKLNQLIEKAEAEIKAKKIKQTEELFAPLRGKIKYYEDLTSPTTEEWTDL